MMRAVPFLLAFCLVCLMAAAFYFQITPLLFEDNIKPDQSAVAQVKVQEPKKNHDLARFDLFGNAAQKPVKTEPKQEELPKTKLKLTLRGVMATSESGTSSALIEGPDRKTSSYLVDEELPGNAVLAAVYADRVTLSRNGRQENLFFPEQKDLQVKRVSDREIDARSTPTSITDEGRQDAISSDALANVTAKLPRALINPDQARPQSPTRSLTPEENEKREALKERLKVLRQRILDQ